MPTVIEPQLATLVVRPPSGKGWLHEHKLDGYRVFCRIDRGTVRLLTRRGKDWTNRFRAIASAAVDLPVVRALLDGEVVVLGEGGVSIFQALQNATSHEGTDNLIYVAFDLLHLNGYDLRDVLLVRRKDALAAILRSSGRTIRYSDHAEGNGEAIYQRACEYGLEGIVSKQKNGLYQPGRGGGWLKAKCVARQEFVIGGFTYPRRSRHGIGALLLGVYDGSGRLVYTGRVGTGFSQKALKELRDRLRALESANSPFARGSVGTRARGVQWVRPRLVAEVAFRSWTRDGLLRQASFEGLCEDKLPEEVVREEAASIGVESRRPKTS